MNPVHKNNIIAEAATLLTRLRARSDHTYGAVYEVAGWTVAPTVYDLTREPKDNLPPPGHPLDRPIFLVDTPFGTKRVVVSYTITDGLPADLTLHPNFYRREWGDGELFKVLLWFSEARTATPSLLHSPE